MTTTTPQAESIPETQTTGTNTVNPLPTPSKPTSRKGRASCSVCGKGMKPRLGKEVCSSTCRVKRWKGNLRERIIQRHLSELNAELRALGFEEF